MRGRVRFARRVVSILAAAALVSACDESPSESCGEPCGALLIAARDTVLRSLGEALEVDVVVPEGATLMSVQLALLEERRWLHDYAVLELGFGADGRLRADAPGSARVEATAVDSEGRTARAEFEVRVEPRRAAVRAVDWPAQAPVGGEVALRGWRLESIRASDIPGELILAAAGGDSASARFRVEGVRPLCREPGTMPLVLTGVEVWGGVEIPVAGPPPLSLPPEQWTWLAEGTDCLRLAPEAGGSHYLLAYVDSRWYEHTRVTGTEPGTSVDDTYAALVSEGGHVARAERASGAALGEDPASRPPDVAATATAPCPLDDALGQVIYCAETPLRQGDVLPGDEGADSLEVVAVHGPLVFVIARSLLAEFEAKQGGAELATAATRIADHLYPILTTSLAAEHPVSSQATGQFWVRFRITDIFTAGGFFPRVIGGRPVGHIELTRNAIGDEVLLFRSLAHELVHAWQYEYIRPLVLANALDLRTSRQGWNLEGGAQFLTRQAFRNLLGAPLDGDLPGIHGGEPAVNTLAGYYASEMDYTSGAILRGYDNAAPFHRDLALRLMRAGAPWDDAVREVSRGVLEGFWQPAGAPSLGLATRMRRRLGEDWNVIDALALWAAAVGADGLTANPHLQDPSFSRIQEFWRPSFELTAGSSQTTLFLRFVGSAGYGYVHEEGSGGVFGLDSGEADWRLLLVRLR